MLLLIQREILHVHIIIRILIFEFSKFALLDLPVYADSIQSDPNNPEYSGPNYIEYSRLFEGGGGSNASSYNDLLHDGNGNVHFAQTFQSYALNLENMLLNPEVNDDFDDVLFQSDAEKIFFKYLYHINAIRVRTATSQEVSTGFSRMIELDDSTQSGSEYSQVIKYIGNIDVTNDKNYKGQQYNEIFVNVPSSVGYTPEVFIRNFLNLILIILSLYQVLKLKEEQVMILTQILF